MKLQVGMHVRIKKSLPTINDDSFRGQEGVVINILEPEYECNYIVDFNGPSLGFARAELKVLKKDWIDSAGCTHHSNGMVSIPMDWSDDEFLIYAKAAHAADLTLNAWVSRAVLESL